MTTLTRTGQLKPDPWTLLADDAPIPAAGDCALSLARLGAEIDRLPGRAGAIVQPGDLVEALAPFLDRLDLVAIAFPGFRDGRGYTSAQLLRARYGFKGEIRAIGDVLADQLFFMRRVGFDSFTLKSPNLDVAAAALGRFSVVYQEVGDEFAPAWARRVRERV